MLSLFTKVKHIEKIDKLKGIFDTITFVQIENCDQKINFNQFQLITNDCNLVLC